MDTKQRGWVNRALIALVMVVVGVISLAGCSIQIGGTTPNQAPVTKQQVVQPPTAQQQTVPTPAAQAAAFYQELQQQPTNQLCKELATAEKSQPTSAAGPDTITAGELFILLPQCSNASLIKSLASDAKQCGASVQTKECRTFNTKYYEVLVSQ